MATTPASAGRRDRDQMTRTAMTTQLTSKRIRVVRSVVRIPNAGVSGGKTRAMAA